MGYGRGTDDYCGATLSLGADGAIVVAASAVDIGQGVKAMLAQLAAAATGASFDRVTVVLGDTDQIPGMADTVAQRITYLAGNAVAEAAEKLKARVLDHAACSYGLSSAALDLSGDAVIMRESGERVADLDELAAAAAEQGVPLRAFAEYRGPKTHPVIEDAESLLASDGMVDGPEGPEQYRNFFAYTYLSQAAIVEVEESTGQTQVLKIIGAYDVGRILNPLRIRGQLEGGALMGVGYALTEEFLLREGHVLSEGLGETYIATFGEMPEVELHLLEDTDVRGPFGARAVSEVALVPTAPAITNAIYDAVGVRVRRLPATAEVVTETRRGLVTGLPRRPAPRAISLADSI